MASKKKLYAVVAFAPDGELDLVDWGVGKRGLKLMKENIGYESLFWPKGTVFAIYELDSTQAVEVIRPEKEGEE